MKPDRRARRDRRQTEKQAQPAAEPIAQESRLRPRIVAALLALATLLVFLPVTRNGFVDYDDGDYVTENRHVQDGLTRAGVEWAFTTVHASNWHPLTWLSHQLDAELFGPAPAGHHATSVVLHALNAALLFLLLREVSGALWRSALLSALFALHPLRVESVAWVAERKDVLSAFFGLASLWAHARSVTLSGSGERNRARKLRLLALGSFALGLLSKPMLVTLPFVMLLLDWWRAQRIAPESPSGAPSTPARGTKQLVLEKLPFFALSILSCVVTLYAQRRGGSVANLQGLPLLARAENALVAYALYLKKLLWPQDLAVLYPHPGHWAPWIVAASAAVLIALTLAAVSSARRRPYLLVGWLWYLGTMLPVIGLVQVGLQSMADRYTYLPLIGVLVGVVWLGAELTERWRVPRAARATAGAALVLACVPVTLLQIGTWRDSRTLFERALAVTERNYLAHNNLGFYYEQQGRLEEAMQQYELSLRYDPDYVEALNNVGHALAEQGRHAEAIPNYERALRRSPAHPYVLNNLGNSLASVGRGAEALELYRKVLRVNPEHADAHNNLGLALAMQGELEEGMEHLEAALRLDPSNASAHCNLGNAHAMRKEFDAAIREYRAALSLRPSDSQSVNNLANVLTETGKLTEAVEQYERALGLDPGNKDAMCNLGIVLLRLGRNEEARRRFEQVLSLEPKHATALQQLALLRGSK